MELAKRNGAEACNKIRADARKKADLFDLYLSGELTRELLAGFVLKKGVTQVVEFVKEKLTSLKNKCPNV